MVSLPFLYQSTSASEIYKTPYTAVMDTSMESQSRWLSPAFLPPEALAAFSSESAFLPPPEEEPSFSGVESDLSVLPSLFTSSAYSRHTASYRHSPVRQVYTSPPFLNNISWLDSSAGQTPTPSYPPPSSTSSSSWHSSPFSKASFHPSQHLSPSLLPTAASLSSLKSLRMEPLGPGQDFKENHRLQECVKGERLTPQEGAEEAARLHDPHLVGPGTAGGYGHSPQSHQYTPTHYTAYVTSPQDHSSTAMYLPSSFSPKMRNKMAFYPPGKGVCELRGHCHPTLEARWYRPLPLQCLRTVPQNEWTEPTSHSTQEETGCEQEGGHSVCQLPHQHHNPVETQCQRRTGMQRLWPLLQTPQCEQTSDHEKGWNPDTQPQSVQQQQEGQARLPVRDGLLRPPIQGPGFRATHRLLLTGPCPFPILQPLVAHHPLPPTLPAPRGLPALPLPSQHYSAAYARGRGQGMIT
ncbi:uncharacterized protein gata1b isoform X1 [Sardina pilchardus]|uniref:uncharacterized protein gata1b isoform X1 n=1 Tax=Sardina pilchardus TaxID=27697 RepID=UPI002E103C12